MPITDPRALTLEYLLAMPEAQRAECLVGIPGALDRESEGVKGVRGEAAVAALKIDIERLRPIGAGADQVTFGDLAKTSAATGTFSSNGCWLIDVLAMTYEAAVRPSAGWTRSSSRSSPRR